MRPAPHLRGQAALALVLLLLVAAADLLFLRGGAEEAPPPPVRWAGEGDQEGDVMWPELAYKALVVEMIHDPANPLALSPRDRLEAHRRTRRMAEAGRQVLWASARIVDLLEADELEEFDRIDHDPRVRAVMFRYTLPALQERALDALRARIPGGRLRPVSRAPRGWHPDVHELEAYGRWRERTRSWREGRFLLDLQQEGRLELPSTEMLDFPPGELLMVLVRIQDDPARPLRGGRAAEVAGYVALLGDAWGDFERSWESVHRMTLSPERVRKKNERKRARPNPEDPTFTSLVETLLHPGFTERER